MGLQVDLTKYLEKHQFNFDEALDESVTQEQVGTPGGNMMAMAWAEPTVTGWQQRGAAGIGHQAG